MSHYRIFRYDAGGTLRPVAYRGIPLEFPTRTGALRRMLRTCFVAEPFAVIEDFNSHREYVTEEQARRELACAQARPKVKEENNHE